MGEKELSEYIKSLNVSIKQNDRSIISPYELDIFLLDYNIAIEYNGDYWHGENFPDHQERDRKKRILCEEKNIILLTIWESNWVEYKDEIKDNIKELLIDVI